MKRVEYPDAIKELIGRLRRMPGIGPRSAERIALWLALSRDARPLEIAEAIAMGARISACARCGFFAEESGVCEICRDEGRDVTVLCVVEQPTDILPLERTGMFRGLYHSLGGRISPLDHIGPENLRIEPLLGRVKSEGVKEVILALGGDVEGEATANYLAELLGPLGMAVTRIAQGLPAGAGLESADELTLSRALSGRTRMGKAGGGEI